MKSCAVESIGVGSLWSADGYSNAGASEKLTASEQMFFRSSPLAHIVRYEQELQRLRQESFPYIAQARRLYA
jgi:hypothetical protein